MSRYNVQLKKEFFTEKLLPAVYLQKKRIINIIEWMDCLGNNDTSKVQ